MTIQSQLDQVLALSEKATPVTWSACERGFGDADLWFTPYEAWIDYDGRLARGQLTLEDAQFIAAAVNFIRQHGSALRAAVGGEAVVIAHRLHTPGGKWQWMNGMPSKQALDDSKNFGWEIEYAYATSPATVDVGPKDLVTVWRAMVAEADNADVSLTLKHCADELAALIGEEA